MSGPVVIGMKLERLGIGKPTRLESERSSKGGLHVRLVSSPLQTFFVLGIRT